MLRYLLLPTVVQKIFQFFLFLAILLVLMLQSKAVQAMVPDQKGEFIQFTAAGHVLGFTKRNYYVANPDHMLHVKFVGATDVAPMGLSIQKTDDENSQLDSVAYFGLWPGINLRYELVDQGIAMST